MEVLFTRENIEKIFGHEAAEREDIDRLKEYYFKRDDFNTVTSNLPLKMVVGFKGVGKSALLKMAYHEDCQNSRPAIWIRPDDISELYDELLNEENFNKLITLWKKGLSRLIASRISQDWICCLNEESAIAVQWAVESGYRSRDLIEQLIGKFKPLVEKYVDLSNPTVNEHRILKRLLEDKSIRIYMDDLDRGWKGRKEDMTRLSALVNALGDLTADIKGLQARITLRTDVYTLLRESDESTDKFESAVLQCSWTNAEILIALVKRINTFLNIEFKEDELTSMKQQTLAMYMAPLFESRMEGTVSWENAPIYRVLMSLIRRRPRDMVKLCTNAAQKAAREGKNRIVGRHIVEVLEEYSIERITDIVNEFSSEMEDFKTLVYKMGPTQKEIKEKFTDRYVYKTDQLFKKIKAVQENYNIRFRYKENPNVHEISHFLFKTGFITARKRVFDGKIERVYYEEKKQLLLKHIGDLGYEWEIHPAFRGALAHSRKENWQNTLNPEDNDD